LGKLEELSWLGDFFSTFRACQPPWSCLHFGAVAMKKQLSFSLLLSSVQCYLSPEATVREADEQSRPGAALGLEQLEENTFYHFDADFALALSCGIEDLALEEANGRLLAGYQEFSEWSAHRERYLQLGATIDQVEVIASGPAPSRVRRVQFHKNRKNGCREYRLLLYEGQRVQALFVGRQINECSEPEEKQFFGFFSFTPALIAKFGHEFADLAAGRASSLREFARQAAIDHAGKQMAREFARQKEQLEQAMRRLQLDGKRYCAGQFALDLEKGLSELYQWKTRMPEILARAEGTGADTRGRASGGH